MEPTFAFVSLEDISYVKQQASVYVVMFLFFFFYNIFSVNLMMINFTHLTQPCVRYILLRS